MLGRRRIFIVGLVIFTASSFFCGFATSAGVLIGARVVQGVGAALMNPATLSIITATFPPRQRGTAIGIWAGVSAMALAIGPLVGGAITEHINWSWVFYINVPIGILGIFAARVFIDESQRHDASSSLDSARARDVGDRALRADVRADRVERPRLGRSARARPARRRGGLLRRVRRCSSGTSACRCSTSTSSATASFASANAVMLLIGLAMFGTFFFVSLFVQNVLGFSPIQAGATFLPMTVLIIFVAPVAGRLSDKLGPRALMVPGLALVTASLVLFSLQDEGSTFWTLLPALLVGGLGMALAMAPTTIRGDARGADRQGGRRLGRDQLDAPGRRLRRHRVDRRDRRDAVQSGAPESARLRERLPARACASPRASPSSAVLVAAFGIRPEQLRHDVAEPKAAAEAA